MLRAHQGFGAKAMLHISVINTVAQKKVHKKSARYVLPLLQQCGKEIYHCWQGKLRACTVEEERDRKVEILKRL